MTKERESMEEEAVVTPPNTDFGYALFCMRKGEKVRRAEWPNGCYIKVGERYEKPCLLFSHPIDGERVWNGNSIDLLAKDWDFVAG